MLNIVQYNIDSALMYDVGYMNITNNYIAVLLMLRPMHDRAKARTRELQIFNVRIQQIYLCIIQQTLSVHPLKWRRK